MDTKFRFCSDFEGAVAGVVDVRGFGAGPEFAQRIPRAREESAITTLVCGF